MYVLWGVRRPAFGRVNAAAISDWRRGNPLPSIPERSIHHAYLVAERGRDPFESNGVGAAGFGRPAFLG